MTSNTLSFFCIFWMVLCFFSAFLLPAGSYWWFHPIRMFRLNEWFRVKFIYSYLLQQIRYHRWLPIFYNNPTYCSAWIWNHYVQECEIGLIFHICRRYFLRTWISSIFPSQKCTLDNLFSFSISKTNHWRRWYLWFGVGALKCSYLHIICTYRKTLFSS